MKHKTNISEKWKKVSQTWLGNDQGVHCHWCKHRKSEEGEVTCIKKGCKYNDGDRIRTWDGEIAETCEFFELDSWYTDDKNYDIYFGEAK